MARICTSSGVCVATAVVAVLSGIAAISGAATGSEWILYASAAGMFIATILTFCGRKPLR